MNVKLPPTHCSGCGDEYDPFQAYEGYTGCCNEWVCLGTKGMLGRADLWACANPGQTWPNAKVVENVRACCGVAADLAAEAKGLVVVWRVS